MARSKQPNRSALIILDMLSDFEFPEGSAICKAGRMIAKPIAHLKRRARDARVPIIYVNDTAGRWQSDQRAFIDRCLSGNGADIAQVLQPDADDYFMFKPKHSAFYCTPLPELLTSLQVRHLVITGMTSHQCVLFTASDAHVRGLDITIVADCIAAARSAQTRHALFIFRDALQARVCRSRSVILR